MFKKIEVAFVTPHHKQKTLDYALDIAKKYGAELFILRCVEKPPLRFALIETEKDKKKLIILRQEVEDSLEKMLDAAEELDIKVKSKISMADTISDCILSHVEENQPDLLILDAPSAIKHEESYYLSILERVSKYVHCPLLTIT